jgi:hypothetical protein
MGSFGVGGLLVAILLVALAIAGSLGAIYLAKRSRQYAQELIKRGEYGGLNAPYYSRSLFFPYPVIKLFGPEATFVLKLVNVGLLASMQLLVYDILRRIRSHQAAQSGSLILLLAPLPAFVTLIPSHDLWGAFFLILASWLTVCGIDVARTAPARWYICRCRRGRRLLGGSSAEPGADLLHRPPHRGGSWLHCPHVARP